jgi:hypothetical protein
MSKWGANAVSIDTLAVLGTAKKTIGGRFEINIV